MPALPALSVEVWQMILRFSISIAGFLDPDTFEGDLIAHGFGNVDKSANKEATYWKSERTRNTLQRVCKAWDAYLRRFEHRYVRITDVKQQRIDEKSIQKATRISFFLHRCTCQSHDSEWTVSASESELGPEVDDPFSRFCSKVLLGLQDLPAEIIDMDYIIQRSLWNLGALRSLKNVKVVTSRGPHGTSRNYPLFSQTPSLRHSHGHVFDYPQHLQFTSRTLVTLCLRVREEESYKILVLDLPALRHLRIGFGITVKPSIFFETVLFSSSGKVLGSQLRSLYIGSSLNREYEIPVEIWERCPNLEIFHPSLTMKASPPLSHPLHTLSIISDCMAQTMTLQWPNLRRFILVGTWSKMGGEGLIELWRGVLQGRGVTFEDSNGLALESAMRTRGLI